MNEPTEARITLEINGRTVGRTVPARLLLSDFLRHHLGLTGTHVGCEHGVCGACNVLVDGQLVRSCLQLAVQTNGRAVTTIEALTDPKTGLHPAQLALLEHRGLQCGFCTPGVLMTLVDIAARGHELTEDQLREELAGNLCRCTGYQGILAAARALLDTNLTTTTRDSTS